MDISEYAKTSPLPKRILSYLCREGIIHDPLSRDDKVNLEFLEQVWGKRELIRAQLSRLSLKARLSFLRTAHLPTKWERYAASRYYNLEEGQSLKMDMLVEEIQTTFCFTLSKHQIRKLQGIRNRVQVARHRQKKSAGKKNSLLQSTNK